MISKTKRLELIVLAVFCLSVCLLSCKNQQKNPQKASRMSRYEQMPDSELAETDSLGKTLLHYAAKDNDTDLIEYFLKRGLEIDRKDNSGFTPLHDAVQAQATSAILFLIDHQADVHAQNSDLNTPLHFAVFRNDVEVAEMLFFNGAHSDVLQENEEKVSPFSHAVRNRYYAMAELLYFPMHYIIKRGKTEYFGYLLQNIEDAAYQTSMTKMTPLHTAHLFHNQYFIDGLSE